MIYEIAEIDVKSGDETAFEKAVAEAAPQFKNSRGCHGMRLHRSIEHASRYRLIVAWETVEAHTVDFRNSPAFQEWRRLAGPYFATPPRVEHLENVLTAF